MINKRVKRQVHSESETEPQNAYNTDQQIHGLAKSLVGTAKQIVTGTASDATTVMTSDNELQSTTENPHSTSTWHESTKSATTTHQVMTTTEEVTTSGLTTTASVASTTQLTCLPQQQLNCSHYCYYGSLPDIHGCPTCSCNDTDVGKTHSFLILICMV